ncbi:DUF1178 family protein [Pseudaestuariivita sp.]|uniref:DUF1178 family protein n=1 Tax=Pseudaestuariivita sp. TaxID=2211669 RepID=UPI00405962DB
MIQYTLKCQGGHQSGSWFQSAAAFDKLKAAGMVTCPVCGTHDVEKALMAPRLGGADTEAPAKPAGPLTQPASPAEQALRELRKHVEANSDYVGTAFATEARAMHAGETPERAIYGEARPDEAKKLIEDGVPVAPLPFRPNRKSS